MSHKLNMGNQNALSSLEIKLLHLLKDGPAGIKNICRKLQVVEEQGQKLTKKLIEQRFVTKQTNSQYRNLIKAEDLPPLPVIKADPEEVPYSCEAKPGNICTHPICTCIKAKCEEEPVVNATENPAELKFENVDCAYEKLASDLENVAYSAAFNRLLDGYIAPKVAEKMVWRPLSFHGLPDKSQLMQNAVNIDNCFKIMLGEPVISKSALGKVEASFDSAVKAMRGISDEAKKRLDNFKVDRVNPINQPGVTFNADELAKVRKLIAIDKANALRQTAFTEIDAEAIENAMEKRKDSPLDDDLKQELYLIAEQLEQKQPTLIKLSNIDKKLNFISYMRLILQELPKTRRLLDDIEADYMELKRLQELQC